MEERKNETTAGRHKLYLNNRRTAELTGVRAVMSFDAAEILLETDEGILMIRGDELHVKRLSLEKKEVDIEGRIDSLVYSEKENVAKTAGSFLGRLFS